MFNWVRRRKAGIIAGPTPLGATTATGATPAGVHVVWRTIGGGQGIQPVQLAILISGMVTLVAGFSVYISSDPDPSGHWWASRALLVLSAIAMGGAIIALAVCAVQWARNQLLWETLIAALTCIMFVTILLPWGIEEQVQFAGLQAQVSDRLAINTTIHAFVDGEVRWYQNPAPHCPGYVLTYVATPSQGGHVIAEREAWVQDVLIDHHQHYAPSAYGTVYLNPDQIHISGDTATVQDMELLTQPMMTLDPRTHTYRLRQLPDATSNQVYDLIKVGGHWLITGNI